MLAGAAVAIWVLLLASFIKWRSVAPPAPDIPVPGASVRP